MTKQVIAVGAPAAVFCGMSEMTDTLQKITAVRTSGIVIEDNLGRSPWIPSREGRAQLGFYTVSLTVTFYGVDEKVWKMAKGIDLRDDVNDPPDFAKYCLFIVHPTDLAASFWLPEVEIETPINTNFQKDQPTKTTLKFTASSRNPADVLIAKGSWEFLTTDHNYPDLQDRSPI